MYIDLHYMRFRCYVHGLTLLKLSNVRTGGLLIDSLMRIYIKTYIKYHSSSVQVCFNMYPLACLL